MSALTTDPNPVNDKATASEASVPAPVELVITPSPDNPANVDIGLPGGGHLRADCDIHAQRPELPGFRRHRLHWIHHDQQWHIRLTNRSKN